MHPAFLSGDLARLTHLHVTDCSCGREHRIFTQEVVLGAGILRGKLGPLAQRFFPAGAQVAIVADSHTWAASAGGTSGASASPAGETIAAALRAAGFSSQREVLAPPAGGELHADDATVARLTAALKKLPAGARAVVALGSGTVNDLCKAACTALDAPLITIPTAASMNGYTSAIAAILSNGVKTTQPCRPPAAILADAALIATAPRAMAAAGYGDLLSKYASGADWLLGHILFDDYYCAGPARVVDRAIQNAIAKRREIGANQPAGLQALTEALLLSGYSMALAGSSSPASGGEHLISHLWDMTAHWSHRTPALHGAQTGVTTLIALTLYEKILALDAEELLKLPLTPAFATPAALKKGLAKPFRELAPAVQPFAAKKFLTLEAMAHRRKLIFDHWEELRDELRAITVAAKRLRGWLTDAGAPVTVQALGIGAEEARFAYDWARWIRDRYTVLDLAADLGMLEFWREEALAAAGV
ncbi:MAG: iron-containing alcohol dehydrogenase [Planctomycetota bacterium]